MCLASGRSDGCSGGCHSGCPGMAGHPKRNAQTSLFMSMRSIAYVVLRVPSSVLLLADVDALLRGSYRPCWPDRAWRTETRTHAHAHAKRTHNVRKDNKSRRTSLSHANMRISCAALAEHAAQCFRVRAAGLHTYCCGHMWAYVNFMCIRSIWNVWCVHAYIYTRQRRRQMRRRHLNWPPGLSGWPTRSHLWRRTEQTLLCGTIPARD